MFLLFGTHEKSRFFVVLATLLCSFVLVGCGQRNDALNESQRKKIVRHLRKKVIQNGSLLKASHVFWLSEKEKHKFFDRQKGEFICEFEQKKEYKILLVKDNAIVYAEQTQNRSLTKSSQCQESMKDSFGEEEKKTLLLSDRSGENKALSDVSKLMSALKKKSFVGVFEDFLETKLSFFFTLNQNGHSTRIGVSRAALPLDLYEADARLLSYEKSTFDLASTLEEISREFYNVKTRYASDTEQLFIDGVAYEKGRVTKPDILQLVKGFNALHGAVTKR